MSLQEALKVHEEMHKRGRQSKHLREGWTRTRDEYGETRPTETATGKRCECETMTWIGAVLICQTCFTDGT